MSRVLGTVAGVSATTATLLLVYFLLPAQRPVDIGVGLRWLAGVGVVIAVVGLWLRAITRSTHPVRRGVQALLLVVTLFVLVSANAYHLLSAADPRAFTEPLGRTDALYFAVTVFATVGFGDITPVTPVARLVVTAQMCGNILVVGGAARAVVIAVRVRHRKVGASQGD